ncbi:hypothetical protein [Stratiformator vulcanicus]|uniref:Uncharacterized protein n=1 Tax=Stratiformator vulcanicus TaxID=2527980 RepID=A0A517R368_9PLAN|nr:hypothetical protein [Stratiformator vulcanicus]QDT38326.1 hypothetical protein Pan189_27170 [Stratiformator vulcanicus]
MVSDTQAVAELRVDRRSTARRAMSERRTESSEEQQNDEGRRDSGRRTKVERRRQIDPTTCERDYGGEEIDFMRAMDEYKRKAGRQFPTWSEVLEVLKGMGYRKVAEPTDIFADMK